MNRRILFCTLILTLVLAASAQQEKDFRERISPWGMTVTVAPGGDLWCTENLKGILYHAEDTHSPWHQVNSIGKGHPDSSHYDGGGEYKYVICPDSNTVLVFGKIYNPFKSKHIHNAYWYSNDRGKTWESRTFASNKEEINSTYCAPSGEVWIAGDSLYFSADKGLTFTKLNHFPHIIADISMDKDGRTGVAGCYADELYYTKDNWTSYRKLPTPQKQHLVNINTTNKRSLWCSVVFLFKEWIIVGQNGESFYSSRDKIRWKRLPSSISPRTTDIEKGILFATTENNNITERKILKTTDLQHFDTVYHSHGDVLYGLCVSNGQLYGNIKTATDHYFCHFSGDSCNRIGFFSDNHPIKAPWRRASAQSDWYNYEEEDIDDLVKSEKYPWGWENRDILHFDRNKQQWYRVTTVPFDIQFMFPYRDKQHPDTQQVVVSDGKQLYLTSEHNPTLQPFRIERPLENFLRYPIVRVTITPFTRGCFHFWEDSISYIRNNDIFRATSAIIHEDTVAIEHIFRAEELESFLRNLNLHYDTAITMGMFSFTQSDYDSVRSLYKRYPWEYLFKYAELKDIYRLKDTVSHFSDSLIRYIMTTGFHDGCTTRKTFIARITNQNGDVLTISGEDESCGFGEHSFMMPIKLRTDDLILPCTHIPFLRFLGEAMPQNMLTHHNFTNLDVLLKCLRYLTHPKDNWEW